jgi:hypothetical protein
MFYLVFLSFCNLMAAFELRRSEIFCKINLDQTVEIHTNNLDCKVLMLQQSVYILTIGPQTFISEQEQKKR